MDDGSGAGLLVGGAFGLFALMWIVWMAICVLALVFWILMLVDVAQRKDWKDENEKITWLLIVILTGAIGAAVYYFVIRKERGKAQ